MLCEICGTNETNNPDGICDDCKFNIIANKDITPVFNQRTCNN
jgi:NMD protein affecting ribosome stability and mRNA decay